MQEDTRFRIKDVRRYYNRNLRGILKKKKKKEEEEEERIVSKFFSSSFLITSRTICNRRLHLLCTVMHSYEECRRGIKRKERERKRKNVCFSFREHVPRVCLDFIITVAVDDDDQHRLVCYPVDYLPILHLSRPTFE